MTRNLDWSVDGQRWPNREASRFVDAGGLRWHVQVMGQGPVLLLLHGTGAATHSWRSLAPKLATEHTIIAPDLPGHGFSATPARSDGFSITNVARAVSALLETLDVTPHAIVGHSAGAAIAVRMALDGAVPQSRLIGINAALLPFPGPLGPWAPTLARAFFYNPMALSLFVHRAAQPGAIAALMRSTGSSLDAEGLELYELLFRSRGHLEATVALMAHWDLYALKAALPALTNPLTLIVAGEDRAVPPSSAAEVARLVARARVLTVPRLGHLAHEEDADAISALILESLRDR